PDLNPGCVAVVLDVDGNGHNEVLATTIGHYILLDHHGNFIWQARTNSRDVGVVDLDLDGFPEVIEPTFRGNLYAYDGRTGVRVQSSDTFESWESLSAGALRQDGLAYPVIGNDSESD